MRDFAAKTVVITGAGSGIGRSLAQKFAAKGAFLAISDVNEAAVRDTADEISAAGGRVAYWQLDVADKAAVYRHAEQVQQEFGRVDIVINNAGVTVNERVDALNYDDFEWVMNINFWGVVYGTKAFLPYLKQAPEAYIVNISSLFGLLAFPTQGAYNASKFAVRGFTEALRYELADTSVLPICVHPGGIDTNIVRNARYHQGDDGSTDHAKAIRDFNRVAKTAPDQAAEQIVTALMKGNRRLLIGTDAKAFDLVQRLLPGSYDKLVGFLLKQRFLR
ncbi:MAG: SDR family oxidoreductase [Oleiphilaceae bacterium]|nr:SDR family oxidoreductase [Oleiphilaceae bacterium]